MFQHTVLVAVFLATAPCISGLRDDGDGPLKPPSLGGCGESGANMTVYINGDTGFCHKPTSFDNLRLALRQYWAECSQSMGKAVTVTTTKAFKDIPNARWQAMIPLDQGIVVSAQGKIEEPNKKMLQLDAPALLELTDRKFRIYIRNTMNTIVFTLDKQADDSFTWGLHACSFVQAYGLLPYSRVPEHTYSVVNFQQWILSIPEEQPVQLELALETEGTGDRKAVANIDAPQIALRSLGFSTEERQVVHLVSQADFSNGGLFRKAFKHFQSRYCPGVADCQGWILSAAREGASLAFRKGFSEDTPKIGGIFNPEMVTLPSGNGIPKKRSQTRGPAIGWLPKGWVVLKEQIIHFDSMADAPADWDGTVLSVNTDSTHMFGLDGKWKATPCTTSLRLDFDAQTVELTILDKRPMSRDVERPIDFLAQETYPECNVQVSITAEELTHLDLLAVRPK